MMNAISIKCCEVVTNLTFTVRLYMKIFRVRHWYAVTGFSILSQEGVTQSDNAAMAIYTGPPIQELNNKI